jgi:hypothetical protein
MASVEKKPVKTTEQTELEILKDIENFDSILKHVQGVHRNGILMAKELIKQGRSTFARSLIVHIFKHDLSKFGRFEYNRFFSGDKKDEGQAIEHHRQVNAHHLDYYDKNSDMPEIEIACMACDLKTRSEEMSNNVMEYLRDKFCKQHDIGTGTKLYKDLAGFLKLIIARKFQ